jgi:hypothetical protein
LRTEKWWASGALTIAQFSMWTPSAVISAQSVILVRVDELVAAVLDVYHPGCQNGADKPMAPQTSAAYVR